MGMNSEEKPLITHLNLNSEDLINFNQVDKFSEDKLSDSESIFVKDNSIVNDSIVNDSIVSPAIESSDIVTDLENKIIELTNKLIKITKQDIILKNNFNKNTKCWWCRNSFKSSKVG